MKKKKKKMLRFILLLTYCKSGNFHATLIFALFAHFWARAKLKTRESVYFVCVSLCRIAEKHEFKNKRKSHKLVKREKLHTRKLPLLQ